MKIIPVGKFESALVRLVDQVVSPSRNTTPHSYYLDLNRQVDRTFTDGVGSFVALAAETVVPWELDWGPGELGNGPLQIGVGRTARPYRESDNATRRYRELQ